MVDAYGLVENKTYNFMVYFDLIKNIDDKMPHYYTGKYMGRLAPSGIKNKVWLFKNLVDQETKQVLQSKQIKLFGLMYPVFDLIADQTVRIGIAPTILNNAATNLIESDNSLYDECLFCAEPLDNISGPGPSQNCSANCNDVVKICSNNHMLHRVCVLNSCNSGPVDVSGQIGSEYSTMRELNNKNKCPFCTNNLLYSCADFRTIPKVLDGNLPMKNTGGKKRIKRRSRKTKRKKTINNRKRKRHTLKRKKYSN